MILIIDDDIAVCTSLDLLLKQAGFAASSASGPEQALEFLQNSVPELIILDMNFSVEIFGGSWPTFGVKSAYGVGRTDLITKREGRAAK